MASAGEFRKPPLILLPELIQTEGTLLENCPSAGSSPKSTTSPKNRKVSKSRLAPPRSLPEVQTRPSPSNRRSSKDRKVVGRALTIESFGECLQPVQLSPSSLSEEESESGLGCIGRTQSTLKFFITSSRFQTGIGSLIALNALLMGLELDQHESAASNDMMLSFASIRGLPQSFFDGFELFFFIMFSIEFILRMFVYRCKLFKETSTYVDLLALSPVVLLFGFNLQSSRQLTLFRIARLVKLCRLLRIFRLFKELNMLVQSIASALRALVWIGLLLLITVYCAAIACTMVIGHNTLFSHDDPRMMAYQAEYGKAIDTQRYWGSMMRSMLTLFQIFTLDGWNTVVRPVVETHQPWMLLFFLAFIFVTTFGLLNLLMGTIVDQAMQIARQHEEERDRVVQNEQKQMLLAAVRLFSLMDLDGSGDVTAQEIAIFLKKNDLQTVLNKEMAEFKIKLDYDQLMDIIARITNEWFDASSENEGITVEEFAGAVARLQGVAKSQDMLTVLITAKTSLEKVEACETSLEQLRRDVKKQDAKLENKLDSIIHLLSNAQHAPKFLGAQTETTACSSAGSKAGVSHELLKVPSFGNVGDARSISSDSSMEDPDSPVRLTTSFTRGSRESSLDDSYDEQASPAVLRGEALRKAEERKLFRRTGASSIATLLKDIDGFDEFLNTKTATVMKGYAAKGRGRSVERRKSDAFLVMDPEDGDRPEAAVSIAMQDLQPDSAHGSLDGVPQIEAPARTARRSSTDGAMRNTNSFSFARLRALRNSHEHGNATDECSSVIPGAVPEK